MTRKNTTWQRREAQEAANRGTSHMVYNIVNDLSGWGRSLSFPVKDRAGKLLLTQAEQDQCWVQHFREDLNQPDPLILYVFDGGIAQEDLVVDTGEIMPEETRSSIHRLRLGKAPGPDEIAPKMLKAGGNVMVEHDFFTALFSVCWRSRQVPDEWRNGVIVRFPKKGSLKLVRYYTTVCPWKIVLHHPTPSTPSGPRQTTLRRTSGFSCWTTMLRPDLHPLKHHRTMCRISEPLILSTSSKHSIVSTVIPFGTS